MGLSQKEYAASYTYDDYKQWEGDWELIYGMPYAMAPAPTLEHQTISTKITWQLVESLKECPSCKALLPIDWKISEDTIVQPDNLVICHKPLKNEYLTKAPAIIFEILSKSTANKDLNLKYEIYEKEGVKYYIIVEPKEKIAKVYRLENGRYIKVIDAHSESVVFKLDKCNFSFDFSKIW